MVWGKRGEGDTNKFFPKFRILNLTSQLVIEAETAPTLVQLAFFGGGGPLTLRLF